MREGDDFGVPFRCDICEQELLPCDHEWGDWKRAFSPPGQPEREIRFCQVADCGDAQYRALVA